MIDLSPQALMTKAEVKDAKKYFKTIEKLALLPEHLSRRYTPTPAVAKKLQKFHEVDDLIRALSENVLFREFGLECNMVIEVTQEDRPFKQFQVDAITLEDHDYVTGQFQWDLSGNTVRKDQMVGEKRDFCLFCGNGRIKRRMIDGSWQVLQRRPGGTSCA